MTTKFTQRPILTAVPDAAVATPAPFAPGATRAGVGLDWRPCGQAAQAGVIDRHGHLNGAIVATGRSIS
jgi:hypothetical protein